MSPTDSAPDVELLIIIAAVAGITLVQALIGIGFLFYRHYKETAKWRRLSEQGIVIIDGPALYWADELPIPPVPVRFTIAEIRRMSREASRVHMPEAGKMI